MLQHIIESNKIEQVFADEEHLRSYRAWLWLIKQDVLTLDVILELHKKVMLKQLNEAGQLRMVNVTVGGRACPSPHMVPNLLANWILDMQDYTKLDPKEMHVRFERTHPFLDGNGRSGRLLFWYHEKLLGIKPTLIRYHPKQAYSAKADVDQWEYYQWFTEEKVA